MKRCCFREALPLGAVCLAAAVTVAPGVSTAMGSLLRLSEHHHAECRLDTLSGEFGDQEHLYKGTGRCDIYATVYGAGNPTPYLLETRAYRLDGRWARATGRTSERFVFPRVQTHKYAKWGELQVVMQCRGDPWLGTTGTTPAIWCQSPQFQASGPVELVRDVLQGKAKPRLPYTAETLDPALRQRLRDEIQRQRQVESATMGTLQDALRDATTRSGAAVLPPSPATTLAQARSTGAATSNATATQLPGSTLTQARTAGSTTSRATATTTQPTVQATMPSLPDLTRGPLGGLTAGAPQGSSLDTATAVGQRQVTSDVPARHAPAASATSTLGEARVAAAAQPAAASLRVVATRVQQGRLWLQVRPPHSAAPHGEVEVELKPVPSAHTRADTVRFSAPMDRLAAGMQVPADTSPKAPGRWQVRVRMSSSAAWSDAVVFDHGVDGQVAGRVKPGGAQALNPQPLPPREIAVADALAKRGLNPQPLPPRERERTGSALQRDGTAARSELGSALQRRVAP